MTQQEKYLKEFFAQHTDEDLATVIEVAKNPAIAHFDGDLLASSTAARELQRRHDSHLSLFHGHSKSIST